MASKPTPKEPIAIIGSACHFAGDASSPSRLWELLREPKDVRCEIPDSRFSTKGFYHPNHSHHGHTNVKHSYLLNEDPRDFDAEFFGINNNETKAMDPQHRMIMETVYEAIESAGQTIEGLRGSDTGVYAGVMCGDYEALLLRDLDVAPTYLAVGTSRAVLSNRISYFFDWHGASVTMDTACSSSLVAVHMAVQALRAGDSHIAIACGSNIILGPEMYIIESKVKMLSPDGIGRMWDKDANGYARGDGVAAICLKTLSSAIADGDHIECIIRETGLNQDGATPGLTMPSATAQNALIRDTYTKAGLDISNPADRPHYFEAHGTGTQAGDPQEAEAISSALFDSEYLSTRNEGDTPLFVGSIKTVLGHTEGTAGVAGIMKASLAIQNATIPPNLHFKNLADSVAPFYGNLQIERTARPWPECANGEPKRASVNSFGFGGTNAHAIIESYDRQSVQSNIPHSPSLYTPFVFSAASEAALRASLSTYAEYLGEHSTISVSDLAYTLRDRRSVFPYRVSFPATSVAALKGNIITRLEVKDSPLGVKTLSRSGETRSEVLGIFTGQGAQYARMGAELIETSPLAHHTIEVLEGELASLPVQDRPEWSLKAEILADASAARLNEAIISQPLCTALQIMLVDLLHSAEINFDAVVGHSSGEIAAAYAAGYLSARDAIVIAYYRGLHCKQARSPNGDIKGAMLAVGTSMEDATELCETAEFAGRITVAANNSSSSVTISGDEDAIAELQVILEDEKKFNRRLQVDQAYHSRHMLPCFDPYVRSLRRAGVKAVGPPSTHCTWFSSVHGGTPVRPNIGLNDQYWAENMTKPVLFSQALTAAISSDMAFDVAFEVGPHPALKGPASQTILDALEKSLPYGATLSRGNNSTEAFSTGLGFLWSYMNTKCVDLGRCEVSMAGEERRQFKVLKGLPSYKWNHEIKHWYESRRSRRMRLRQQPFHPLLGDASPDSAPHVWRWKNVLKPSEITWIEGHQVQGQIVFPAAGYVATAIEAAKCLAEGTSIRLIELSNFSIHQAITFDNDDSGIEVLIEITQISRPYKDCIIARFTYSSAMGDSADFQLAADGELKVSLGDVSLSVLPERGRPPPNMIPVDEGRLYGFMESLEYNFSGPFRSLTTLRRKLGKSTCVAKKAVTDDSHSLLVHPCDLDAAFQSVMLAYSYPGDDQLRNLHLPTNIAKVRVNPAVLATQTTWEAYNTVDSTCSRKDRATPGSGFSGSVNLYTNHCSAAAIQVDSVRFKPVGSAASDDRNVFYQMHWVPSAPDGELAANGIPVTQYEHDLMWVLSRIASYFLRQFDHEVPEDSSMRKDSPHCHYLNYARHMNGLLKRGEHKYAKEEWLNDTFAEIENDIKAKGVSENADVRIMLLVGKTMPRVFRSETTMLEHFRESGLLDEYYAHGFGTMQSTMWLGQIVKQLTDQHPHLNLLEIGAGTGGATKNILQAIDRSFDKYTFTDISSSFFENAAEALSPWKDRMVFKVCDAEKDPLAQGFTEGSYDVIIAYMVIHATAELEVTMRNLRKLLKPGGFIMVGEGGSDGPLQAGAGFIFGTLPGWWRGVEEGRILSPLVNLSQWDAILKRTGFSGIDTMSPPRLLDTFGIIMFVAQAIDERVELIRQPLSRPASVVSKKIVVIGGQSPAIAVVAQELKGIFEGHGASASIFKSLEQMDETILEDQDLAAISLTELDRPIFQDLTPDRWYKFRQLFAGERTILWLTSGRVEDDPYSNMTPGFGRSAIHEEEQLRLQFMDVPDIDSVNARTIAEAFVRLNAQELDGDGLLYTREREIIIDAEARHLVPRLKSFAAANNRYNSIQRRINEEVDVSKSVVKLYQSGNGCSVRQLSRYEISKSSSEPKTIELYTTHTILSALKTPLGHKFLAMGVDSSGDRYLALVPSLTSILQVSKESAVLCYHADLSEELLLMLTATSLVAQTIVGPLFSGQRLLCHNAPDAILQAIVACASDKGVEVAFTTDHLKSTSLAGACIKLPPYIARSELSELLPSDITCFVNFSDGSTENEQTILASLPPHCRRESCKTIFAADTVDTGIPSAKSLGDILESAVGDIQTQGRINAEALSLEQIVGKGSPEDHLTIIDWISSSSVTASVARLDINKIFRTDKTYWLCGLSGALGISLCDWMIDRGVTNLVLTSRNPKIDPQWIEDHKRNGIIIEMMPCDVTDEQALRRVHQKIVSTLPPIIGVLNGAMVLRDVSVRNMSFEQVRDVIRPKVLGSIHLDNIFHDTDLDFFVLLSSINCVIGNVGQANYAAANMGMCGVAANRRKRGLASSVVNVGAIIGVGYITQSDRQLDVTVAKTAMMHLSEEDFHQIFAEAMEAGYPDSSAGPEISTGLLDISPDSANIPKWYYDPKFARFIVHKTDGGEDKKEQADKTSIKDRLRACRSEQELLQIIKQAFAAQLRRILQSSTADEDLMSVRGTDLGLDSLISVDLRSWFLKNFQVSIPVLKIMANDVVMSNLAQEIVDGIPVELVPNVKGRVDVTPNSKDSGSASPTTATSSADSPSASTEATSPERPSSAEGESKALSEGIDWDVEGTPPAGIELDAHARPPKVKPEVVVLTGVSGLLGHHLLNALIAQPSISKVICIAVRRLQERLSTNQLPPPSHKITYHEGDLALPNFGLSSSTCSEVFALADAIIHNGSDTSHLKYYSALRTANVESTKQLIVLCLPRRIPLHYVGSAGIALFSNKDPFPEVSVNGTGKYPPSDGAHGYMCGKWVCETLLERTHAMYGLPVTIQRPSTIVRQGEDAQGEKAEMDWVNALLFYCHKIKAVPKVEYNRGAFDLVYVQSVCEDIISGLWRDGKEQKKGVKFVNNVGDVVIPMNKMAEMLAKDRIGGRGKKGQYEVLSMETWGKRAIEVGLHPAVAALIETFDEPGAPKYPELLKAKA